MDDHAITVARLVDHIRKYQRCLVAFSGGVDSALVAKLAHMALANQAIAVTSVSPSLAEGELDSAREVAQQIGIQHRVIRTSEFDNSDYLRNASDRCFHCKTELYTQMNELRDEAWDGATMVNGTNVDDLQEYRPGLQAAEQHAVRSPLAECGISKTDVRKLAAYLELPVWDKPAMPCLASRVAYGQHVTPERLRMVDRSEQFLRQQGFATVRVRFHEGDMARVEVPVEDLPRLVSEPMRSRLSAHLHEVGFRFVTLDLEGFRSGSLNTLISVESLLDSSVSVANAPPRTPDSP